MRIIYCAYRDWAIQAVDLISSSRGDVWQKRCHTPEALLEVWRSSAAGEISAIVLIGWSWKVPNEIVESTLVVGMHPSDLPEYAGGSPIQHQITEGVRLSRATLFRLSSDLDAGDIIDKEPIDLRGHLDRVLRSITLATVNLVSRFLHNLEAGTVQYVPQGEVKPRKRLTAESGLLRRDMTCEQLWDAIRCREHPYPNAYFSDSTGELIIREADFYPPKDRFEFSPEEEPKE